MELKFSELDIKDLLGKVKIFEPNLGDYQFFTITEQFYYLIKLSNGTIHFKLDELIANKEDRISRHEYELIAKRFSKDSENGYKMFQQESQNQLPELPKKGILKTVLLSTFGLLFLGLIIFIIALFEEQSLRQKLFGDVPKSELFTSSIQNTILEESPKTEEELKDELYEIEKKDPEKYLNIRYRAEESLLFDQMKFEGSITNSAALVTFRNFEILIKGYSNTDYVLDERRYTITETVSPTGSTSFELRTEAWDRRIVRFEIELKDAEGI
ncbi:hypothetical protein [Fluviicola sp.]|uniref:hypothetical protein n=1 Tax=Fluviicola sp. TaxID=1917219 RepID=UPI003D28F3BF